MLHLRRQLFFPFGGIGLVTWTALLGHSKINMVMRYAHPTQEHQARSAERLEQFNAKRQLVALRPDEKAAQELVR
jgi:hypothetical protein